MTLYYDTETTGFPRKRPLGHPSQPHIVSIGAVLADGPNVTEQLYAVVRPDGWDIPEGAVRVHGITPEQAMADGIPEGDALEAFMDMAAKASLRVAYNEPFDARIMAIARHRHGNSPAWDAQRAECAMATATRRAGHHLSLSAACAMFLGRPHEGAHNALSDAMAAHRLHIALMRTHRKGAAAHRTQRPVATVFFAR